MMKAPVTLEPKAEELKAEPVKAPAGAPELLALIETHKAKNWKVHGHPRRIDLELYTAAGIK